MSNSYGCSFSWHRNGGVETYSVSGCASRREAESAILRYLEEAGYRPPRWWEYWRWDEQKPPKLERESTR